MKELVVFKGKAVSVNKWKDIRVIKKGNRHIPVVYLTEAYRHFKSTITTLIDKNVKAESFFDVHLVVFLKFGQDSDSCLKPLLDAVTDARVIIDDKYCRNILIERHYHSSKRTCMDLLGLYINPLTAVEIQEIMEEMENEF